MASPAPSEHSSPRIQCADAHADRLTRCSFVPLSVPADRRLQTAAVITWSVLRACRARALRADLAAMVVPAFFLLLCSLPPFWPLVIVCALIVIGASS